MAIRIGSTTLCTFTLSGGTGGCTLTATQLGVGTSTVTAAYTSSNANIAGSSTSKTLVVSAASTTTTLSFTSPVNYGAEGSADFVVTVSTTGATPTGTVAIERGSTTLCTITLSGGTGTCTLSASQLAAGTYSIAAVYDPANSNFATSSSHY